MSSLNSKLIERVNEYADSPVLSSTSSLGLEPLDMCDDQEFKIERVNDDKLRSKQTK